MYFPLEGQNGSNEGQMGQKERLPPTLLALFGLSAMCLRTMSPRVKTKFQSEPRFPFYGYAILSNLLKNERTVSIDANFL
jgi:hypothetical protein